MTGILRRRRRILLACLEIFDRRVITMSGFMFFLWLLSLIPNLYCSVFGFFHILPECVAIYLVGENLKKFIYTKNVNISDNLLIFCGPTLVFLGLHIILNNVVVSIVLLLFAITYYLGYFSYKGSIK